MRAKVAGNDAFYPSLLRSSEKRPLSLECKDVNGRDDNVDACEKLHKLFVRGRVEARGNDDLDAAFLEVDDGGLVRGAYDGGDTL